MLEDLTTVNDIGTLLFDHGPVLEQFSFFNDEVDGIGLINDGRESFESVAYLVRLYIT